MTLPVPPRLRAWARRPCAAANMGWTLSALAMVAGLCLRLWSINQARFSGEESWFWSIGCDIAAARNFPVLGHPISGTAARHPGSAFFWLLGLTQLGAPSPLRAYALFSLSGLVVLVPLALVVARTFDRATAAAFLVLSAVSPWWIVYTNSAWPSYLIPTLCALLLVWLPSLARGSGLVNGDAADGRRSAFAQGALAFLLVIGFQVHLSALHFWLITLVTLAVWRPRPSRPLLIGLALGALCYLPYLIHEVGHGFANTLAIVHRSQGGGRSFYVLQGLLLYFLGFTTTDVSYLWNQGFWYPFDLARFWRGSGIQQTNVFFHGAGWGDKGASLSILSILFWVGLVASWAFTVLSWMVFIRVLWRRLRSRAQARRPSNVLLVAFVTAVAGIPCLYLLSGKGGYPHYVSTVLPLAFLPPAYLLGRLLVRPLARWAAVAYLLLFAGSGFLGLRGYYAVDSRWSVPQTTAAVKFILERTRAADGTYRTFKLDYGFNPNWPSAYQLTAAHLFGAPFLNTGAGDLFRVDARLPGAHVAAAAAAAAAGEILVLPTLTVVVHRVDGTPAAPVSPPGPPTDRGSR